MFLLDSYIYIFLVCILGEVLLDRHTPGPPKTCVFLNPRCAQSVVCLFGNSSKVWKPKDVKGIDQRNLLNSGSILYCIYALALSMHKKMLCVLLLFQVFLLLMFSFSFVVTMHVSIVMTLENHVYGL